MAVKRIFLIDGHSYLYRAFHATPYLANSKGLPTNAAYAFTNMLRKLLNEQKPDDVIAVFDSKAPSFREEIFKEYKATRPPMPSNMPVQIPYVKKIIEAMGIPIVEEEGFEADDVIGTLVEKLKEKDVELYLVTGDKDMMQFVSENIFVLDSMKGVVLGEQEVTEKFGVKPALIPDFLALCGDTSDNIPGVLGIGEKTARELVSNLGTIEEIYEHLDKVTREAVKAKLNANRDNAFMSKKLATIRLDVPLRESVSYLTMKEQDTAALRRLFRELEFTNLYRELKKEGNGKRQWKEGAIGELKKERVSAAVELSGKGAYQVYLDAFAASDGESVFFSRAEKELFEIMAAAKEVIVHGLKPLLVLAKKAKATSPDTCFDTMLASYLINPLRKEYAIDGVLEEFLDSDLSGGSPDELLKERAFLLHDLAQVLSRKMEEDGLLDLFRNVEMPLVDVLAEMEFYGVKVDRQALLALSNDFDKRLNTIMKRVYELAEETFNINSPQQLGRILFDKLNLPPVKKTKTAYSTDTEVLQALAPLHALPSEVLQYRTLSKLKNTYIDVLPLLINGETGRIHASFNQMVVATGRLSSSDPNLQNIPIRGDEGRKIREAFVAEDGFILLSADYSQIELRVLAHMSRDELLLEAFSKDEDIHSRVAQEVFRVGPTGVTSEMRRTAKVINFGVVYGISGFGLAKELGVSPREAQIYIDGYFQRHKGVQAYIDATLEFARERGFVKTLLGRTRIIPEIRNPDTAVRQFGERTAVNTPLQGTAADIIKLAMVKIHKRMKEEGMASRLIIQIHDELVFEVKESELSAMKELVKHEMEHALDLAVPLRVSLGTGKNWAEAHD
ncbi:MAG TPA: DNA polymerase I [Syntrophorhabdales bacterium]|nr:DNA polymerase I [Syntrophorhabdales bacterium]